MRQEENKTTHTQNWYTEVDITTEASCNGSPTGVSVTSAVAPNLEPGPWDLDVGVSGSALPLPPKNNGQRFTVDITINSQVCARFLSLPSLGHPHEVFLKLPRTAT